MDNKKEKIIQILEEFPVLTGKELLEKSGIDILQLWRLCKNNDDIKLITFGKQYLRFDKDVEGFARMSPSIKREFHTYTLCTLKKYADNNDIDTEKYKNRIKRISDRKYKLALNIFSNIIDSFDGKDGYKENICVILAGDIIYNMAHNEPRPERSTGKLVDGSDLDVILITKDSFDKKKIQLLDKKIYQTKYMYLKMPNEREEIDYVIKDISKTMKQLEFDCFEYKIAVKILYEGKFLYGNRDIFQFIKDEMKKRGLDSKLNDLEELAIKNRIESEKTLLHGEGNLSESESMKLFFTKEESDEIF